MSLHNLLINGELLSTIETFDVIDPATGQVFAQCPKARSEHLDQAVAAAQAAFEKWRLVPIEQRRSILNKVADAINAHAERVIPLLTREQGKTLSASAIEVAAAEAFCRQLATGDLPVKVLLDNDYQRIEIHRKPLGVVAGITPWNFPFLIAVYKLTPALLAGNSIILKPSPTTPLTTLLLGEIIRDLVPPGLVNILADAGELGPLITAHAGIAKITFTGSTATGKAIMANAANTLKRLTLELGGNDAGIVLDDVIPREIAQKLFDAAFANSGQVCAALKRLYVHDSIYEEVCDELKHIAVRTVVGIGTDPSAQFGPVQNKMQYDKICKYIEIGRADGEIIAGGNPEELPGYCIPITLVKNIQDGSLLVDEEPFGPVLPIMRFSSDEDALRRANNSGYALGGSVWSGNIKRGQALAQKLEAANVWVNQHAAIGPHIPLPTAKESGIGVEWSDEGLLEFTTMQVVNIAKNNAE
tara:strand:+ start:177 stop:1592 length:1416 start_codon:yes stop_codon:yes gene_type:complete